MRNIIKAALAAAGLTFGVFGFHHDANAQANLCALLPESDVSSVIGNPVKLDAGDEERNKAGSGSFRSRTCNYDPRKGLGTAPNNARVTITESSSPAIAAQMYKVQTQLSPGASSDVPLKGVGDEAQADPKGGTLYMRKKNISVYVQVGRRDLDVARESAMAKELAQKIAARIP